MNAARGEALTWLAGVKTRAEAYADKIDPKRRRRYDRDPVLRALDTITAAVVRASFTANTNTKKEG